jgi:hypothetical protein
MRIYRVTNTYKIGSHEPRVRVFESTDQQATRRMGTTLAMNIGNGHYIDFDEAEVAENYVCRNDFTL